MSRVTEDAGGVMSVLYRVLLTWGFVAIGVVTLGFAGCAWMEAEATEDWPSTVGRITETSVAEEWVSETRPRTGGHSEYRPEVRYEYAISGVRHTGDRIALEGNRFRTLGAASVALNDYQVGQEVTVYYDPSQPDRALLEVGRDGGTTIGIAIGGLIVGGCGLLFLLMGRMTPERLAKRVGPSSVGSTAVSAKAASILERA